jgi:hypothetical protein
MRGLQSCRPDGGGRRVMRFLTGVPLSNHINTLAAGGSGFSSVAFHRFLRHRLPPRRIDLTDCLESLIVADRLRLRIQKVTQCRVVVDVYFATESRHCRDEHTFPRNNSRGAQYVGRFQAHMTSSTCPLHNVRCWRLPGTIAVLEVAGQCR